jgi:hypothetical protein
VAADAAGEGQEGGDLALTIDRWPADAAARLADDCIRVSGWPSLMIPSATRGSHAPAIPVRVLCHLCDRMLAAV